MTGPDAYFTVAGEAQAVFRDRGSRFIGMVFPLEHEKDFSALLDRAKKEYPAARHYCYAWALASGTSRSSDDGEPGGTAGKPILNQIVAAGLASTAVIVVRYFGGTLLGKGGLVNAYRSAAEMALTAAGRTERFAMIEFLAAFGDADMGPVMRALQSLNAEIVHTDYRDGHLLRFRIKAIDADTLKNKFADLYRVRLTGTFPS